MLWMNRQIKPFNFRPLDCINPILAMFPFYTPENTRKPQKTFGFLAFSRGIKWEYWPKMGYSAPGFHSLVSVYCFIETLFTSSTTSYIQKLGVSLDSILNS